MCIDNEIFDHFRKNDKAVNDAMLLLVENGFQLIDKQYNVINKDNIDNIKSP